MITIDARMVFFYPVKPTDKILCFHLSYSNTCAPKIIEEKKTNEKITRSRHHESLGRYVEIR